jgi:hypothetical protein
MLKTQQPAFPSGYPAYEIITISGVDDVVEHRKMEPVFYIADDLAVWGGLIPGRHPARNARATRP